MDADKSLIPGNQTPIAGYPQADLLGLLDELGSKKLIVICGPSKIGKSTLIRTYIESRSVSNIWHRVDKDANNLAYFFYCMDLGLRKANPRNKIAMPDIASKELLGDTEFAKAYFRKLYQNLELPFLIVLDDYQEVADDAVVHSAVRTACSELPEGGRIVIITQKKCPPTLAQLRNSNITATIESEDFQCRPSEANH